MFWNYRNETKSYVIQAIREMKMVKYNDFCNVIKLFKIDVSDKKLISAHIFANINSIIKYDVLKFLSGSW